MPWLHPRVICPYYFAGVFPHLSPTQNLQNSSSTFSFMSKCQTPSTLRLLKTLRNLYLNLSNGLIWKFTPVVAWALLFPFEEAG